MMRNKLWLIVPFAIAAALIVIDLWTRDTSIRCAEGTRWAVVVSGDGTLQGDRSHYECVP